MLHVSGWQEGFPLLQLPAQQGKHIPLEIIHYLFNYSFCRKWALKEQVGESSSGHLLKITLGSERHASDSFRALLCLAPSVVRDEQHFSVERDGYNHLLRTWKWV